MGAFHLVSEFQPRGDQPQAISKLVEGLEKGQKHQVLLGVTGRLHNAVDSELRNCDDLSHGFCSSVCCERV